jgi:hypothetical protein
MQIGKYGSAAGVRIKTVKNFKYYSVPGIIETPGLDKNFTGNTWFTDQAI